MVYPNLLFSKLYRINKVISGWLPKRDYAGMTDTNSSRILFTMVWDQNLFPTLSLIRKAGFGSPLWEKEFPGLTVRGSIDSTNPTDYLLTRSEALSLQIVEK